MIHYDPHKWLDHFFDIKGSAFKEVLPRVLACGLWAAAVVTAHKLWMPLAVPSLLHALVGVAIGLLLVFRTNASYDRYWEGRRLWGGIVNSSRNLIRAAQMHLPDDTTAVSRLARWTAAFPYAARNVLRGVEGLGAIEADLPASKAAAIRAAQHRALAVSEEMSACLADARRRGAISDIVHVSLDQFIKELIDHLGGCERIRNTPLPFAYVVHLRRALVIYCFTLPFAIVDSFGWAAIADVILVAYVFFGIEEIGVEIEGPFGFDENDLPLDAICETIRKNLYALANVSPEADLAAPDQLPEGL